MPKLDSSIDEEPNIRVTRGSRRGGSVDLELESTFHRTPLKSNLEAISETGSIDSLTPRRSTRRSIAPSDLGTPIKTISHLTKENLSRLEKLNNSTENPPTASKRITRRNSTTSEDVVKGKLIVPLVRLVRIKAVNKSGEICEDSPKRILESSSKKTQNKLENKVELPPSPYNIRRSISKSPSIISDESKIKKTEIASSNKMSSPRGDKIVESAKSGKTPVKNLRNETNQTSTPIVAIRTVEQKQPAENESIEIIQSSEESDGDDSDEYYRNTSLKKFTGTVRNKVEEEKSPMARIKLAEENLDRNNKGRNNNDGEELQKSNKTNFSCSKTKVQEVVELEDEIANKPETTEMDPGILLNWSSEHDDTLENDELVETLVTRNRGRPKKIMPDNISMTSTDSLSDNNSPTKRKRGSPKKTTNIVSMTSTSEKTPTETATPLKQATPAKVAISNQSNSELNLVNSDKSPSKLVTPGKQETPLKQTRKSTTPANKQATPTKQATPGKLATPTKQETPAKQATPVKQTISTNPPTSFKLVEKLGASENVETPDNNKSIDLNETSNLYLRISETLTTTNNSSQSAETTPNGSKELFIHELNESCKVDHELNKKSMSHSFFFENIDKVADQSPDGTFETFSGNLFGSKAKSCSPESVKKNLLQSPVYSSFHGPYNIETLLERDEREKCDSVVANRSNTSSGIFVTEDSSDIPTVESESNLLTSNICKSRLTYVIATAPRNPESGLFVESDNNVETEPIKAQEDESMKEISSAKKQKRKSSVTEKSPFKTPVSSFIQGNNHEKAETGSAKKHNSSETLTPRDLFIETDNQEEVDVSPNVFTTLTNSAKKQKKQLSITNSFIRSASGSFTEIDNQDLPGTEINSVKQKQSADRSFVATDILQEEIAQGSQDLSRTEKNSAKKQKRQSSIVETVLPLSSPAGVGESEVLKTKVETDYIFVTKRKGKLPFAQAASDCIVDDQSVGASNISTGDFIEDNQNDSLNQNPNKLNSSKIKKSKEKTPKKVEKVKEKREISLHEIQARCNEILQERMLARQKERDQFGKKKDKKKQKKKEDTNEDTDYVHTPNKIEITIQINSPKPKKSENLEKDTSVGSNNSGKLKFKKLNKPSSSETLEHFQTSSSELKQSKLAQEETLEVVEPTLPATSCTQKKDFTQKTKKDKLPPIQPEAVVTVNVPTASMKRRIPDDILSQLDDNVKTSHSSKKLKLSKFIEKEKTPEYRPSGFKVSPITPKILPNKFRVSLMPKEMPKKKLTFNEPTNSLPQPIWTSAGVFEESDFSQENRKSIVQSTTNFIVEDIGDNFNRAYRKIDKKRKADLIDFKKKSLFRSSVPRGDAKRLLNLKSLYAKGNIKLISK